MPRSSDAGLQTPKGVAVKPRGHNKLRRMGDGPSNLLATWRAHSLKSESRWGSEQSERQAPLLRDEVCEGNSSIATTRRNANVLLSLGCRSSLCTRIRILARAISIAGFNWCKARGRKYGDVFSGTVRQPATSLTVPKTDLLAPGSPFKRCAWRLGKRRQSPPYDGRPRRFPMRKSKAVSPLRSATALQKLPSHLAPSPMSATPMDKYSDLLSGSSLVTVVIWH